MAGFWWFEVGVTGLDVAVRPRVSARERKRGTFEEDGKLRLRACADPIGLPGQLEVEDETKPLKFQNWRGGEVVQYKYKERTNDPPFFRLSLLNLSAP